MVRAEADGAQLRAARERHICARRDHILRAAAGRRSARSTFYCCDARRLRCALLRLSASDKLLPLPPFAPADISLLMLLLPLLRRQRRRYISAVVFALLPMPLLSFSLPLFHAAYCLRFLYAYYAFCALIRLQRCWLPLPYFRFDATPPLPRVAG